MRHLIAVLVFLVLAFSMVGCAAEARSGDQGGQLLLTDGVTEKTFSVADLRNLPETEAVFNDVTYKGVRLATLLEASQIPAADLRAVKVVAQDGFSANYDPPMFMREDVIVAYATTEGEITMDDGLFRMVLPGEDGKLNVRMLVKIQAIP
jgi:hypothetical protein